MIVSLSDGSTSYLHDENGFTIYANCLCLKNNLLIEIAKKTYQSQLKQTEYESISKSDGEGEFDGDENEDADYVDEGQGHIKPSDVEEIGGEIGGYFLKEIQLNKISSGVKSLLSGIPDVGQDIKISKYTLMKTPKQSFR